MGPPPVCPGVAFFDEQIEATEEVGRFDDEPR
jgi:hypothetical protein